MPPGGQAGVLCDPRSLRTAGALDHRTSLLDLVRGALDGGRVHVVAQDREDTEQPHTENGPPQAEERKQSGSRYGRQGTGGHLQQRRPVGPLARLTGVGRINGRTLTVVLAGWVVGIAHSSQERSEEHTSELQSRGHLVCRLLLEKKKKLAEEQTAT